MTWKRLAIVGVLALAAVGVGQASAKPYDGALQDAQRIENAFTNVAEAVSPSVVSIRVEVKRQPHMQAPFPFFQAPEGGIQRGGGSGVVLTSNGYILTNNHVVENATRIDVNLKNGKTFRATLVGTDPASDLAVLKIKASKLAAATFAASDEARVGQWVLAIGSPFGLDYTVTTGVLSAKGRGGIGANEIEDYLQTDASINPGNSGGPLVDLQGHVLGINTMIIGRGTGIGFAIPAELARDVAKQIMDTGSVKRAWLGVAFQELTPELAAHFDRSDGGALVSGVAPNGPAAKAGIRSGDIIVGVGDVPVKEGRDLLRATIRQRVGKRVSVQLIRAGKPKTVQVVLGKRPTDEQLTQREEETAPDAGPIGLSLQTLTSELRARLNYDGNGHVIVQGVVPGSDAERAGLRRGDIILEADHVAVRAPADITAALRDGSALLHVERGDWKRYVVLERSE